MRNFEYDAFDNLVAAQYSHKNETETIYRVPDKIGNLFKTKARTDRKYSKGGRLEQDAKYNYYYDAEGNLLFKEFRKNEGFIGAGRKDTEKLLGIKLAGSGTGWRYKWAGNGMLQGVANPHGSEVRFSYDPLGRRIAKQYKGVVTRWLWDGNVPLHEWRYEGGYPPKAFVDEEGKLKEEAEPVENLITWVYEEGSFVPCAKIVGDESFSIIADYLGTPTHAFDKQGNKVWERELDIYGAVRKEIGIKGLVPQLYQGQMMDAETGLAYNRFRYYDNESGGYISQDPIGLEGGFTLYGHLYLIHKPSTIQYWLDSCNSFAMKIKSITGLFDEQNVLAKLTQLGDPLVLVSNHIDFSLFEKDLLKFTGRATEAVKPGKGRPGYNVVTMVKILFLQRLYNLSDAQVEFQITDRLSFRRFLSIPFSDAVPDCKTVWAFRESLNKTGENRSKQLFELFLNKLNEDGLIAKEGKMMDATFVSVPIQRNSRKENAEIKEGKIPSSFSENKNKLAQKDTDASWTKKNNVNYFGYKNHIKAETKRKFITGYIVTDAAPHDSTQACELLTEEDRGEDFYGDSAYQSPEIKARLKALEMKDRIIEKGHRNHPLTVGQKQTNRKKSKTRCRIEHIFGHMTNNMNDGTFIRTIGKARATVIIGLNNLVYNICRYVQLKKLNYA